MGNINKIALITSGNRGLGKSIAMHLAKEGHDIVFTYRGNKLEVDAVMEDIKKLGQKAVV